MAVVPHVKDYRKRIYPPLDTLRLFVGRSSGFPVAPCSSTRLLPVKVAARVNKACCVVCLTASRQGMSCLAYALLATWWIIEGVLARGGGVVMAQHGCCITDFARG